MKSYALAFFLLACQIVHGAPPVTCHGNNSKLKLFLSLTNNKAPRRTIFEKAGRPILNLIMGLRYTLKVVGLEAVAQKEKTKEGIFFLPDHFGHTVDPVFIWLSLNKKFRPRMAIGESQAQTPFMKWLVRKLNIIVIPENIGEIPDPDFEKRIDRVLQEIANGLKNGENFVFYPAGQIARQGKEDLQGKSGVKRILNHFQNPRIVLVRQRGLWGSGFTFGFTGTYPQVGTRIKDGVIATLKNFIFFNPRRSITISFQEDENFPRTATAKEIRNYLENFYNEVPNHNTKVPLTREEESLRPQTEITTEYPSPVDISEDQQLHQDLAQMLNSIFRDSEQDTNSIRANQNFWTELGIDSIDMFVLLVEIENKFHVRISPKDMAQVKTLNELAKLISERLTSH
jgi:long-chain-fatty-acid--[acyl-carrier-protein] ligase